MLLARGADPNTTNKAKEPVLVALYHGILPPSSLTRLLLQSGAKINAADTHGITALVWTILREDIECLELLLTNGADPNVKFTFQGRITSPMALATKIGNQTIIRILESGGGRQD
jgi:ankyrin repeat protein